MSKRWYPGPTGRVLIILTLVTLLALPHRQFWTPFAVLLAVPVSIAVWRGERAFARPWLAFIVSFLVYVAIRRYADELGPGPFAEYVIRWERAVAFGIVPTISLQDAYSPGKASWWDLTAIAFHLSHFVLAPVVGIALWRLRSPRLPRFLLAMSAMYLVSAAVHLIIPTVPPWLAGQLGHLPTVYLPQSDLMHGWAPGFYGATIQTAGGNPVAAMPSVHAATAAGIALSVRGPLMVVGWLYVAGMALALVYLGHHYVVDIVAGNLLMVFCWCLFRQREVSQSTIVGGT